MVSGADDRLVKIWDYQVSLHLNVSSNPNGSPCNSRTHHFTIPQKISRGPFRDLQILVLVLSIFKRFNYLRDLINFCSSQIISGGVEVNEFTQTRLILDDIWRQSFKDFVASFEGSQSGGKRSRKVLFFRQSYVQCLEI